jgi:serine/threonine-protein kinase
MVMVYVPTGEFEMGSSDEDLDYALQLCSEHVDNCEREWFEHEQPVHIVALDAFWIDRTEVTNAQYRKCVEAGACERPTESSSYTRDEYYGSSAYDEYPVIWVDWQPARAYCEWAGARLPTEAEWEYAARGSQGHIYPWGDSAPDCDKANYRDCVGDTSAVGSYPAGASWCGALDMAGNVWEWVAGRYGDYTSERQVNPTGPPYGGLRVLRGGSWGFNPFVLRSAFRSYNDPVNGNNRYGFRCARRSE